MLADQLFQAGRLEEAVRALGAELRDNPGNAQRRTFLFELLCFSGDYERAGKQLDILAQAGPSAEMGALLYRSALHAERLRKGMFETKTYPVSPVKGSMKGTLNGKPFESIADADPRIGARLEVFAAGDYLWIPFEYVTRVQMNPPRRLRDLLWSPGMLRTGPGFEVRDLGEVLLPVLTPLSSAHPDDSVRLGRTTVWEDAGEGEAIPVGQKMLIVDGEEVPFLEIRDLEIEAVQTAAS